MFERIENEANYNKFYFLDTFHFQCENVDPLTMDQFDRSCDSIKKIIDDPIFRTCKHVIATGCGDSNIGAFSIESAFEHYLPDVEFEAVESIELSRHYDFPEDCSDTIALFISFSGGVYRTIEALLQCKRHGIKTVAVTDNLESRTAKEADILYHTNDPKGDNHAGLRTYYSNVISCIILAASMAEKRTGNSYIPALREAVQEYHDRFFSEFLAIDDFCFALAIHWLDKKYIELVADGPMFWAAKFVQAKIIELSGDPCTVIDSEDFMHVNQLMIPHNDFCDIVIINSNDANTSRIVETLNHMLEIGRPVALFSDKTPEELGIKGDIRFCHMPVPSQEWNFLAPIYAYLPGSIFGGFRHTTLGEPMFRGGFVPDIFVPTYFSPIDVIEY